MVRAFWALVLAEVLAGGCWVRSSSASNTYVFVLLSYGVIPAQAGIQWDSGVCAIAFLGPRVRGEDGFALG